MNRDIRQKLFDIIFEADTSEGKTFDILLLIAILISVVLVLLESVPVFNMKYGPGFQTAEWVFTAMFTIEYLLRIFAAKHRSRYIFSFFGIIDFLAILPAYLGLFLTGAHTLIIIRAVRLLRVFRILKISRYTNAGRLLVHALKESRAKIGVFLFSVLTIVLLIGTLMYLIEGEKNGFTSIPKSIYWAIVTITTVGYGDLTPLTTLGQFFSSALMITGYAIIAVPTGIITAELINRKESRGTTQVCPECMKEGHDTDAKYCKYCGSDLNP